MISNNSFLKDKDITKSLSRLKQVSSDKKFRVKSLRLKTLENNSPQSTKNLSARNQSTKNLQSEQKSILNKLGFSVALPAINIQQQQHNKIRVKSLPIIQKNYEKELVEKMGIKKYILKDIYSTKIQQEGVKHSNEKYVSFLKAFYHRIAEKLELNVDAFNFKSKSLKKFLEWYLSWQGKTAVSIDLSHCCGLTSKNHMTSTDEQVEVMESLQKNLLQKSKVATDQQNSISSMQFSQVQVPNLWPNNLIERLILSDNQLCKISLRNMRLSSDQIIDILQWCLQSHRIYSLDLSNKSSQTINRIGSDYSFIEEFFAKNQLIGSLKLENLNFTNECGQSMSKGIRRNLNSPIKILSLAGNLLTANCNSSIYYLARSGVTELNLSSNPLGPEFFLAIKNWKASTIRILDLSSTLMDSESLIYFLGHVSESKYLQVLKLDRNNFSHHWFNKIKDIFGGSFSAQSISFVECNIKSFTCLFEGLTHCRYLKKLNLNYNLVELQRDDDINSVLECLKSNKALEYLRLRFCGFKENILMKMFKALQQNSTIKGIDISENHFSDRGTRAISSCLNQCKQLKWIGLEKLQISVKSMELIQKQLKFNKSIQDKKKLEQLKITSETTKKKEIASWKQIEQLQTRVNEMHTSLIAFKAKNAKLENAIQTKRVFLIDYKKQCRQQQIKTDRQLKKQEMNVNSKISKAKYEISQIEQRANNTRQKIQEQSDLIAALQAKIQDANIKIKNRQNQLEQQLRDQVYLKKKKQKEQMLNQKRQSQSPFKQKKSKLSQNQSFFDNTKSISKELTKQPKMDRVNSSKKVKNKNT